MSTEEKYRCLNKDAIKYIAMFTMLLNHIATVFMDPESAVGIIFIYAGYFTAPVMIYFLLEGYEYTRSRKRYLGRLFLFAVISELPFCLALTQKGVLEFYGCNMLFTLCLCFLLIYIEREMTHMAMRNLLIVMIFAASTVCDWAIIAPAFTLFFIHGRINESAMKRAFVKAAAFFGAINFLGGIGTFPVWQNLLYAVLSMAAVGAAGFCVTVLYNGKRMEKGKNFSKWFFYIFYPAHLLILGVIRIALL